MQNRTSYFLTIGLVVFVLVLGGAVAIGLVSKTVGSMEPSSGPTQDQTASSENGVSAADSILQPAAVPVQTESISPERATRLAFLSLPGGVLQQAPFLVNYQGRMAYEVLISGNLVYVDAFSGEVLGIIAPDDRLANVQGVVNGNAASGSNGTTLEGIVTDASDPFYAEQENDHEQYEDDHDDEQESDDWQLHHEGHDGDDHAEDYHGQDD